MAGASESKAGAGARGRLSKWALLRPTARFRRQFLRALIVSVVFVAFLAALSLAFGIDILQYALSGFVVGSIVIVAAIGLTILYGIRGFANFAYGDIMTLGAYVALLVSAAGLSVVWGAVVSFVVLALVGILLERVIFSRLEGRGVVAPVVASVGVGLIIQNGIRAVAGTNPFIYPIPAIQDIPIAPGLGIHPVRQIATLTVGLAFVVSAHMLLKYTNLGKAMRATADNLELAKATGIDTKRVVYAAWAASCALASTAGVLIGLSSQVSPLMGFNLLLIVFAAVIVGGIGSPYGAMLGALLVGLSQEMSVPLLLWLGQANVLGLQHANAYKIAVPFIILIVVLIFRPWGIAGKKPAFARRAFLVERLARAWRTWRPSAGDLEETGREG